MTTGIRRPVILLALGAAFVIGACSGGIAAAPTAPGQQPPAASDQPVDGVASPAASAATGDSGSTDGSCSLVTNDAVATAAGFPIATTAGGAGICYYQNTDVSKYLVVWRFDSQDAMAAMLQIESGSEHIASLGDDAFWSGAGGILFVRKGDHGVEFQEPDYVFTADTNTAPRDAMIALARTALPNL